MRSLSAMAWIISQRSASCCGPSHMIATFHESSWGTTEMARSVGHSLMSSISSLMAASSSSRVFAGFFKCPSLSGRRNGTTAFGYPRERMFLNSGREPLAIRYRRRPQTAGGGPTSQRLCRDNVPTACYFAGGLRAVGVKVHLLAFLMPSPSHRPSSASSWITCLYPDFRHQEHGAIRFAIAPAGLWIRRPSDFRREPFPFKTIQGGQRGKRRCDRSSYLRDGPVGTGQYRVRTARTRLGMGMPSNITREDNQWHRIFRLPSQDEAWSQGWR